MIAGIQDHGLAAKLRNRPLSHAYILSGGSPERRQQAAVYLAAAALCSGTAAPCGACAHCRKLSSGIHPDLHWLEREKDSRQIVVDQIRALQGEVYVLPNEAEKSVFAIKDAHFMNPNAQNALLKVFEEPPRHALILLLTENAGALLPTLRSRAVTLRLGEGGGKRCAGAGPAADAPAGGRAANGCGGPVPEAGQAGAGPF